MRRLVAVLLSAGLGFGPLDPEGLQTVTRSRATARPRIVEDHIPYGLERKRQMARYSRRHYGARRWRLRHPRAIVLHFTGGSRYSSAWNHFASNAPARGELPGVCAHYMITKTGRINEVVAPRIRCRHAIGLNHRAIGIEMVQETGRGSHWASRQILRRRKQVRAALRLVAWLRSRHSIKMRHVIGHAMANNSPFFKDLQGWRNDHTDWPWREVKIFRRRLARFENRSSVAVAATQATTPIRATTVSARVRKRVVIGHSVEGKPIRAMEIGDPSSPHVALVVGCIHGSERAGRAVVRALRRRRAPRNLDLWLIRDLNPDGLEAHTRQNARGVDLNRNFRRKWRRIGEPWDTYHSGRRPFSEPESRAARDFIRKIKPDVTIWYHQAMRLIYYSGGERRIQARYARLVGLPLVRKPKLPGAATRWQNYNFPASTAFVVELAGWSLTRRAARRHARAVIRVGRL